MKTRAFLVLLLLCSGQLVACGDSGSTRPQPPAKGDGETGARRQWQLPADDGVAAHEARLGIEQVHRAAASLGDARLLAEQLSHDPVRIDAASEDVAVLTVVREHIIAGFQRGHHPDDGGLFAKIEMAVAADLGPGIHLAGLLFEAANHDHLPVEVNELLT